MAIMERLKTACMWELQADDLVLKAESLHKFRQTFQTLKNGPQSKFSCQSVLVHKKESMGFIGIREMAMLNWKKRRQRLYRGTSANYEYTKDLVKSQLG